MRIVAFSDTHGSHQEILIPPGDVLVFAGDMVCVGGENDYINFAVWFNSLEYKTKIIVAGNHDGRFQRDRVGTLEWFEAYYLEDDFVEADGVKIYGSPWTPEFQNWAFMKKRGNEIKAVWDKIPNDTDVLVTHGPPSRILDTNGRESCGCYDLKMAVERVKPKFHIFGHIHSGYGKDDNKDTVFANVSMLDNLYGLSAREPAVLDIQV